MFPALAEARELRGVPDYYYVRKTRNRVYITLDAFFVEEAVRQRLEELYTAYVRWWGQEARARRQRFPRGGVWLCHFNDWTGICVLPEHAEWWIELFNQAAPLTYDPWAIETELREAYQAGAVH